MRKISLRLWALMLLLICITFTLLWIFQIEFLGVYYRDSQIKAIKNEGNILRALLLEGMEETINEKLEEFAVKYNAGVDIYDKTGALLYKSESGYGMMGMDRRASVNKALQGNYVQEETRHKRFSTDILIIGIPVKVNEETIGAILLQVPLAAVEETAGILKQQLSIIIIILIIVSLMIAFFFSKSFTRPILKINEAATKMAAGNLAIKVNVSTKDELGMLAETINNLSEQLLKIEQLRRDLIANVSHEFRTPLSLIKGYAETIRDMTGNDENKRNKQLNIIIEESDRLKIMIDDILNLSQMQSEYYKLNITSFDIIEAVNEVSHRFSYIKEKKNINLRISHDDALINVTGDEMRIEQVLYNLIGNAFNHSPQNSEILISIKKMGNKAIIEVKDNGKGIKEVDIPHIWNRFYKASSSVEEKYQGSGLGLAIVKAIMEAHKCNFGVESEEDRGAKFWFELALSA